MEANPINRKNVASNGVCLAIPPNAVSSVVCCLVWRKPAMKNSPAVLNPEIDHREKAALKALVVQREQADHDETQVADAAVGQETPKVRLDQRHDRAIHDRRQPEAHHD